MRSALRDDDPPEAGRVPPSDTLCGVLCAARHRGWAARVVEELQRVRQAEGLRFDTLSGPAACNRSALAARREPIGLLLAFTTRDTLATVQRTLRALGAARPPTLVVARGLQADEIAQLLDTGVEDFLPQEFGADEFVSRVRRLLPAAMTPVAAVAPPHRALANLVGTSPAFLAQIERIPTMAGSRAAVLILGDTGTGKELCAQAIHYMGPRASGPWIAVNCAALPADLVEAELFGHARGAFTSAHQANDGLIAQAEGGTLFLDEVDSLPLASQAKLLRFLQEREYRPLGGTAVRHADVRVVAASNANLAARAEEGTFRRDLYFRLAVLTLKLPTLRERPDDIEGLALHFVDRFAREQGRPAPTLDASARRALRHHAWPGNVRELEHCIERAVLFSRGGDIRAGDLELPEAAPASTPPAFTPPADAIGEAMGEAPLTIDSFQAAKARVVQAFERQYIERLLSEHRGNISRAAAAASKNRRAFWELLRRHVIDAERFRSPM